MRLFGFFSLFILSTNALSGVIVPIDITLLSGTKTNETPLTRMIDGSGLSDDSLTANLATVTHNSADQNEARLFDPTTASVRLDLGRISTVSEIFYWNTNTAGNNDVASITYDLLDSDLSLIETSGAIDIPGPLNLIEMPANEHAFGTHVPGVRYVDVTFTPRASADSYAPGEIRLNDSRPGLIFSDSFEGP